MVISMALWPTISITIRVCTPSASSRLTRPSSCAVEDALRAPSVHNSQPWRWRISVDEVRLHADLQRHLIVTDPDLRDLVLSCGAAPYAAIAERRTDRRRTSRHPVPAEHRQALVQQAARDGAILVPVTNPAGRRELLAAIVAAERLLREEPGYASELRTWTHRLPGGHDEVPASNVTAPITGTPSRPRCVISATPGSPRRAHAAPDTVP
jgi:hypothetical protein